MLYRGVEYEIEPVEPGVWKWQCRIGDEIKTGKTKCDRVMAATAAIGAVAVAFRCQAQPTVRRRTAAICRDRLDAD